MIYSIEGTLVQKQVDHVVILVNGIGYGLHISLFTYGQLQEVGEQVFVHTYLHVREDLLDLYGFATAEEKDWFKLLISVSGIGSKAGLAILSGLTPTQLRTCILHGDSKTLTKCQGIGPKTAQRAILELKDKVKQVGDGSVSSGVGIIMPQGTHHEEAVSALLALGYAQGESSLAVSQSSGDLPVEEVIKSALHILGKGK